MTSRRWSEIVGGTLNLLDNQKRESVVFCNSANLNIPLEEVREIMTSLQSLIDRYTDKLAQLEMQVSDVKHKLNIVMEASRLLEEEGLSER